MTRLRLCVFVLLLLGGLFFGTAHASDIKEADELFEKSAFQDALKIYEAIYEDSADDQVREKAFFRMCESLAHLFRHAEAAQEILSREDPEQISQRARFLILKSEILENFQKQYARIQRRDKVDEKVKDVFRLTPDEIKEKIRETYVELWHLRADLARMGMVKEGYYLDIENVDLGMYPTLFDYLILVWTDFLLDEHTSFSPKESFRLSAESVLVEEFQGEVDLEDPPVLLVVKLLETASRPSRKERLEAGERWRIKRLLLPLRHRHLFELKALADDTSVFDEEDLRVCRDRTKKILLKWMDNHRTKEARAEAGYEAAQIFNSQDEFAEAVKLCKKIEKRFRGTHGSRHAKALRTRIEMPELSLRAKTVMPPGNGAFEIQTRNLKEIYFRLYRIEPEALRNEYESYRKEHGRYNYDFEGWSRIFNQTWFHQKWGRMWLKSYLTGKYPHKNWTTQTEDTGNYKPLTKSVDPPTLEAGIYLVLACGDPSFKIGRSLLSVCFLNVTNLVLVGTAGVTTKALDAYNNFIDTEEKNEVKDEIFRLYTLDAETGKPVSGAALDIWMDSNRRSKKEEYNLTTSNEGLATLPLPIQFDTRNSNHYSVDPLANKGNSHAYWSGRQTFFHRPPNPILLFIETDRPIYQPGQKVQAKVIGVKRTAQGFKAFDKAHEVTFAARDPNNKEFFRESVELNEFGSASVDFDIPHGRLLGRYALQAYCQDGRFYNEKRINFSVEEYKRPEFEINLKPAEKPWKYNEPVEIKGEAVYYFGGPVPDAPVTYRIIRQTYIPFCFRYWFGDRYSGGASEVATGETKTDSKGFFFISFTPTPPPQHYEGILPDISQFRIEVEGRDSGGRTITTLKSYKAGKNPIYLAIEQQKGFFLEKDTITIELRRLTINDTPAPGKSRYEIFVLAESPTQPHVDSEHRTYRGSWRRFPPLDVQLKDVPNGEQVGEGKIEHDENGRGTITIEPLPQGTYRIVQKSQSEWGNEITQSKIFVVAKDTRTAVPLNAPSVTLVEKEAYEIEDVARFIIGSGIGSGIYHIELWAGEYLLSHQLIDGDQPVRLLEIPVTQKMKGGFSLRWFGARHLDIHHGEVTVSVPWTEKKLDIFLDPFDKELKPNQEYTWGVRLRDSKQRPIKGEVLALMYDRSLEYYVTHHHPWLDGLYSLRTTRINWGSSVFNPSTFNPRITHGLLDKLLRTFRQPPDEPNRPGLRTSRLLIRGGRHGEIIFMGVDEAMEVTASDGAAQKSLMALGGGGKPLALSVQIPPGMAYDGVLERAAAKIDARKKFSDTAFFKPHIVTASRNGRGQFTFVAPEQLTSWKVKMFAFTKDIKEAALTEEVVTKKDLMVRADLPRFFREKDKGTITAIVHNESERSLIGDLFIEVTEHGNKIHHKLGLEENRKPFEIQPHGLASFNWLIEIPSGVSMYKVRVAAVTDQLSDAEERDLPILPSRQRLIESTFTSLSGSESKTLKIPLKDDPTRINESMVLQIEPQLALSILNSIPFLIEYPYGCVEQILNKYVPLSIINAVYKKYPAIQKAVSKIPDRKTPTPPWEKENPNRLITLMETPWVWQSEGRPTIWPIIDLLDPEIVEEQKEINLNKLISAQHGNGAFPWWPGGRPDPYMTLYVLSGLAEARRYGVEVPKDMIKKALEYTNREIPLRLKPEARDLALVSFAAYVVTSYPTEEFPEAQKGHEAAKSWVIFLDRHVHSMTPFARAYLAYTYFHLGNHDKAQDLLDMAMDGAREDPIAGVYWTPEKYSWVWYSDTVEKHAFLLRTLQELRPEDKRIPGMVQWLLFSRKGSVWKSTKASVAAVYALLDNLHQRGALDADEFFKAKWGEDTHSVVVKADDWLEDPIRWQEKGFEITPDKSSATIEKDGPGISFASLTWTYSTDRLPEVSQPGMLELERKFFRRVKEADSYHLKSIKSGGEISVGDQIEVQLKINTRSQFEYMHLKDLKAAGFEAEKLLSGWRYDPLWFYEEPRHSLTNFFLSWLPHGEYILRYRLRPTKPGVYRIGAATLQSMYAPEMTAHSAGFILKVVE